MHGFHIDEASLDTVCKAYHVKRLAVFGSRMRGDEIAESDLDLLVEFESGKTPGLRFFRLQRELSSLFHLSVDLNTAGFLSPYFRDQAVQSAKTIYANP
jgi:predicted nucleotidyltransferase